MKKKYL